MRVVKVTVTLIGLTVLALVGGHLAWDHQLTAVDRTTDTSFDGGMMHRTDVHSILGAGEACRRDEIYRSSARSLHG